MATKRMKLRRDGSCDRCGVELPAGTYAVYDNGSRSVRCVEHEEDKLPADSSPEEIASPSSAAVVEVEAPSEEERPLTSWVPLGAPPVLGVSEILLPPVPEEDETPAAPLVVGATDPSVRDEDATPATSIAGSSARREYERRKAKDEAKLREEWGRLGGLAVALSSEKQTTKAWDRGAVGEEKLGKVLDSLGAGVVVLHDRRIPKTKANVDHIVVTAGGIWVVDAKRYRGRPELRIEGGLLRPRVEKLVVAGRDRTKLVEGVNWQVGLLSDVAAADGSEVSVRGVMCFVDADWPLFGGGFEVGGVLACWPAHLAKLLKADAGEHDVAALAARVAAHFPPA